MREEKMTADRLTAFSDAVFAVIVTIMVLELKAPDQPAFSALWPLWPWAISYAVSYLFIVIIWINHHHLMRFVGPPTLRLIWINFVHLFLVSLLPFATAWIARTKLASPPVAFYAGLFVCIDIAYNLFEREVFARADATQVSARTQRMARRRSVAVLAGFTTAVLVALIAPSLSFGLICGQARLFRKSRGTGAILCYLGHVLTDNRHGLVVNAQVTQANGKAERDAAAECSRMWRDLPMPPLRSAPTRTTTRRALWRHAARMA
jgi:uncharacterized membrane protein